MKKFFAVMIVAQFFFGAFFVFGEEEKIAEDYAGLIINEVQVSGEFTNDDFVEIYNDSDADIVFSKKCFLAKCSLASDKNNPVDPEFLCNEAGEYGSTLLSKSSFIQEIKSKQYIVVASQDIKKYSPEWTKKFLPDSPLLSYFSGSTYSLAPNNSVAILCSDDDGKDGIVSKTKVLSEEGESRSYDSDTGKWYWGKRSPGEKNISEEKEENDPEIPEESKIHTIRISEIFPDPLAVSDTEGEFVEIYNAGSSEVDLSQYVISDGKNEKKLFGTVAAGEYKALYFGSAFFTNSGKTYILKSSDEAGIDSVSYESAKSGWSWSFDGSIWRWTPRVTPDGENMFPESILLSRVILSEVLPNPEGEEDEEFIEIFNDGIISEDISYWSLSDVSGGSYMFPEGVVLDPQEYFVVEKPQFLFSLNNTKETIFLKDPMEKDVDRVSYNETKTGVSYGFDGKKWRMTKSSTPGKQNVFDKEMKIGKNSVPKKAYQNVWVYFSPKIKNADEDEARYRWDFGDGSSSSSSNPKHRYAKKGTYTVELSVDTERNVAKRSFQIKISSYPKRSVRIAAFEPNPVGKDEEGEWIQIRNEEKKAVDLKGWSVASGTKISSLANIFIDESIVLSPGEEKKIFREEAASFSLPNSVGTVELRYPDGRVAHRVAYSGESTSLPEGETYRESDGKWLWEKTEIGEDQDISVITDVPVEEEDLSEAIQVENAEEDKGDYEEAKEITVFEDVAEEEKGKTSRLPIFSLSENIWNSIDQGPRVSGASIHRLQEKNGRYIFVEPKESEHYLAVFFRDIKQWMRAGR